MDWADSGAWYIGVAWVIALAALIVLVVVGAVQWLRRPTVKWALGGLAYLEQLPADWDQGYRGSGADQERGDRGVGGYGEDAPVGVRADLRLTNVGTGPAYGVETVRSLGAGTEPYTVFEAATVRPGESLRIDLLVPDEQHWNTCWIRPQARLNKHRFDAAVRRFPKIPVAEALADEDDPEATHVRR